LKIQTNDLEFNSEYFYIKKESIVEKITFNNRTFYSKFKKYKTPISTTLFNQHQSNEISLALPLIEKDFVNYIVIEYKQNDWKG